jgi:LPS O-antigen subunit length determinant protein (WzzB/FepE family)
MNTIEQEETRTRLYTPPASGADEVDVLDLLDTLARRKWLLLKVTVACALISTVAAFVIPSWYTATAMILPPQQTQSTANMLMTQLAGNGLGSLASLAGQSMGMTSPNDLYIGILHSRSIQDTLIGQFALQKIYSKEKLSDARRSLQKHSDVASTKEGLIQISV